MIEGAILLALIAGVALSSLYEMGIASYCSLGISAESLALPAGEGVQMSRGRSKGAGGGASGQNPVGGNSSSTMNLESCRRRQPAG